MNTTSARRTKVKGHHPGVFYRLAADGKRKYEIAYRHSAGRLRWETVAGNLEDAEALRDARRGQKRRGEVTAPAGVRFADVVDRYLASPQYLRLASTTSKSYADVLASDSETMKRYARRKIAAIDSAELARYVYDLERQPKRNRTTGHLRQSSVENILKPIRGVFRQAVKEHALPASPFSLLDADEKPQPDAKPHEPHQWTGPPSNSLGAPARSTSSSSGRSCASSHRRRQARGAGCRSRTASSSSYSS
jgi:hypothetical protein